MGTKGSSYIATRLEWSSIDSPIGHCLQEGTLNGSVYEMGTNVSNTFLPIFLNVNFIYS